MIDGQIGIVVFFQQALGKKGLSGMGGTAKQNNHAINSLQFLRKANNPVRFLKSHIFVKLQAHPIVYLTIAGKLSTTLGLCPAFTNRQKRFYPLYHINP
jgi:hypothetical protein